MSSTTKSGFVVLFVIATTETDRTDRQPNTTANPRNIKTACKCRTPIFAATIKNGKQIIINCSLFNKRKFSYAVFGNENNN